MSEQIEIVPANPEMIAIIREIVKQNAKIIDALCSPQMIIKEEHE